MSSPGVINASKFVAFDNKAYGNYVNYIDRDQATRTKMFEQYNAISFDGYNHYMKNPEKSTGLFTIGSDCLDESEKKELKNLFTMAQKNDSVMWQDVISFDNAWLEKHGIYDSNSGFLDEAVLRDGVRDGVQRMLVNEGLERSAVWSAAIHYNTDNIHIHVATVEPYPTREYKTCTKKNGETYEARRGYRKLKSIDLIKQRVASKILDRTPELTRLSQLVRQDMSMKHSNMSRTHDKELKQLFLGIYQQLPSDKRLWKYNNQAMTDIRPNIDKFTKTYLEKYHDETFKEFEKLVDDEVEVLAEAYGIGSKMLGRPETFKETKMTELMTNLGNDLLKEMKVFDRERYNPSHQKTSRSLGKLGKLSSSFSNLSKALNKTVENHKNQQIYRKHLHEKDQMER